VNNSNIAIREPQKAPHCAETPDKNDVQIKCKNGRPVLHSSSFYLIPEIQCFAMG